MHQKLLFTALGRESEGGEREKERKRERERDERTTQIQWRKRNGGREMGSEKKRVRHFENTEIGREL